MEHKRWMTTYMTNTFSKFKNWIAMDSMPSVKLIATLRVYQDKEGELFIRIGNHLSHTSGYWFRKDE